MGYACLALSTTSLPRITIPNLHQNLSTGSIQRTILIKPSWRQDILLILRMLIALHPKERSSASWGRSASLPPLPSILFSRLKLLDREPLLNYWSRQSHRGRQWTMSTMSLQHAHTSSPYLTFQRSPSPASFPRRRKNTVGDHISWQS